MIVDKQVYADVLWIHSEVIMIMVFPSKIRCQNSYSLYLYRFV